MQVVTAEGPIVLKHVTHGAGERDAFEVATDGDHLVGHGGVIDPVDPLFDDRAFVEIGGHEMRRRADQLHAAREGLVIGFCALETRQERMVDIDRAAVEPAAQIVGQDLHIPRQHHDIRARRLDQVHQFGFGLGLGVLRNRDMVIGNACRLGLWLRVRMVGHDRRHFHRQRADAIAVQQIVQAMVEFRHHDHHLQRRGGIEYFPFHVELMGDLAEPRADHFSGHVVAVETEYGPAVKPPGFAVREKRRLIDRTA